MRAAAQRPRALLEGTEAAFGDRIIASRLAIILSPKVRAKSGRKDENATAATVEAARINPGRIAAREVSIPRARLAATWVGVVADDASAPTRASAAAAHQVVLNPDALRSASPVAA